MRKRRSAFIVLEMYVALALLALVFFPLLRGPYMIIQKRRQALIAQYQLWHAEHINYEVLHHFAHHEISRYQEQRPGYSLDPFFFEVPGVGPITYHPYVYVVSYTKKEKEHPYDLLHCSLSFSSERKAHPISTWSICISRN
ncbi:MAG: hypothetical protein VXZ72_05380 [Chlamydiota bacterium]|nr:hypothetical protein [Chlamydiota bacterium]